MALCCVVYRQPAAVSSLPLSSSQNLPTEHVHQAFVSRDTQGVGTVPTVSFAELMRQTREHKLSPFVSENLLAVGSHLVDGTKVKSS